GPGDRPARSPGRSAASSSRPCARWLAYPPPVRGPRPRPVLASPPTASLPSARSSAVAVPPPPVGAVPFLQAAVAPPTPRKRPPLPLLEAALSCTRSSWITRSPGAPASPPEEARRNR